MNWYFHTYQGGNPFGFAPLDIKSYYMGLAGCAWAETRSSRLPEAFRPRPTTAHNAEADAVAQAEAFRAMVDGRCQMIGPDAVLTLRVPRRPPPRRVVGDHNRTR